jgi:hypothetical protein
MMQKDRLMNNVIRKNLDQLWIEDRDLQNEGYYYILKVTDKPVDWAYEAWDEIVKNLSHADNHNRAIAAQVLCNLARSDPQERILKDFKKLLNVSRDERFVTARHCMQSLWKVGVVGVKQQKLWMEGLTGRFGECITEKNCQLIRYDILQSFRNVYDAVGDEKIKAQALKLIETEEDVKYRKKYMTLWRNA